jgi:hypothetical protein
MAMLSVVCVCVDLLAVHNRAKRDVDVPSLDAALNVIRPETVRILW